MLLRRGHDSCGLAPGPMRSGRFSLCVRSLWLAFLVSRMRRGCVGAQGEGLNRGLSAGRAGCGWHAAGPGSPAAAARGGGGAGGAPGGGAGGAGDGETAALGAAAAGGAGGGGAADRLEWSGDGGERERGGAALLPATTG